MVEEREISAAAAIEPAFRVMKRMLFEPFDFTKWLVVGFCAALASLGQGGGNIGNPFGGNSGRGGPGADRVLDWIDAHMVLIACIAGGILLIAVAIGALFTWLSSRGEFMFLDCIVRNRAEVSGPWSRYRTQGNNLFVFRFVLGLIGLGSLILVAALAYLLARPDIQARRFGGGAILAIAAGGLLVFLLVVIFGVIKLLLHDFVVPIMYKREVGTMVGFGMLRSSLLPGHFWAFVLFYLLKLAFSIASGILMMVVILCTCFLCLMGCIPILNWYAAAVVFLPVFVFMRCYSLCFLQQFGEGWRLLPADAAAIAPQPAAPAPASPQAPEPVEPQEPQLFPPPVE
jgi:hypothetical protein